MIKVKKAKNYKLKLVIFHFYFSDDINFGVFVIFFTLIITISMIYGAIKGKPKMLIPFFCMQLFDLFVTM